MFFNYTAEDDLSTVFHEVSTIQTTYPLIGRELGLPPNEIDVIKEENGCVDQRFTAVLRLWLNQRHDVNKHGLPTWRKLVEVVDSSTGGKNHSLAKTIASHHPAGIRSLLWVHYIIRINIATCNSGVPNWYNTYSLVALDLCQRTDQ